MLTPKEMHKTALIAWSRQTKNIGHDLKKIMLETLMLDTFDFLRPRKL
jgi:hypothetical protein